jgi:hypothetical protein
MGLYLMVDGCQLLCNLLLFGFEQVKRDGIIIMSFEQFLPLTFELVFFPAQAIQLCIILLTFLL